MTRRSVISLILFLGASIPASAQEYWSIDLDALKTIGPVHSVSDRIPSIEYSTIGAIDESYGGILHQSAVYDPYGRLVMRARRKGEEQRLELWTYDSQKRASVCTVTVGGTIAFYTTRIFDSNGDITEKIEISPEDSFIRRTWSSYGPDRNLLEQRYKSEQSGEYESTVILRCFYDRNGRNTMDIWFDGHDSSPDTTLFEDLGSNGYGTVTRSYQKDAPLTFHEYCDSPAGKRLWEWGRKVIYEAATRERLEWISTFDSLGKRIMYARQGNDVRTEATLYNREGMVWCYRRNLLDTSLWRASFFTYDSHGNPVRCDRIVYDSREDFEGGIGRLEWQETVEYSYDSYGNWIEAVKKQDGAVINRLSRHITYYPDGYRTDDEFIPGNALR